MKDSKKMAKQDIQFALRELLTNGEAGTHEDICQALERQGFQVNQPKVSRLLHKLGAIKVTDQSGCTSYRLPHEHGLMHEVAFSSNKVSVLQYIIEINHNDHLVVVSTMPGAASLVAREIDLHRNLLGVLGCIAGDDTIFVAPKSIKDIRNVIENMKKAFT